jgi:hypothetical protein
MSLQTAERELNLPTLKLSKFREFFTILSIDELKAKIKEAFGKISNEMHHNVWSELEHRLYFFQVNNGEHVGVKR